FKKLETRVIPETFSYDGLEGIRKEALEKLKKMRPASIGQASRISGVSPADISVLLVYLKKYAKENG
ncbi:MAG: tRNA uridine-5-carboxymethylaminomethyl(34) synthesis enzyme MnmG, partial [Lachnospiraceae bacterium]|nr:tRNA uridine-5-carboxymethylaminomethyl(34) synthesis enzyme MnmG [Lachnospiraceae bacterium]